MNELQKEIHSVAEMVEEIANRKGSQGDRISAKNFRIIHDMLIEKINESEADFRIEMTGHPIISHTKFEIEKGFDFPE